MSDLLPQIEPGTSGSVEKLSVPIGKYLGESFHSGQDDSILSSLSRTTEDQLSHDTSPVLSADDANKKWGVGNLKFTQPTQESLARILNGRERDRMDQQAYLYSGATKERFIPGMAASMLGAMANPVDLGSPQSRSLGLACQSQNWLSRWLRVRCGREWRMFQRCGRPMLRDNPTHILGWMFLGRLRSLGYSTVVSRA